MRFKDAYAFLAGGVGSRLFNAIGNPSRPFSGRPSVMLPKRMQGQTPERWLELSAVPSLIPNIGLAPNANLVKDRFKLDEVFASLEKER